LKALSWLRIVWNLKTPPEQVLRNEQQLGSRVISRAAHELAGRFDSRQIARSISSALRGVDLAALQSSALHEILDRSRHAGAHLPRIPTREEFLAEAKAIFARSRSLNEIVDHAYEHFLVSVRAHLVAAI
jgi:stearoyl-CoA desaturase (delta-9 desaturase)